jgi:hypothetical protein
MKNIFCVLLLGSVILDATSCKTKTPDQTKYIPKDAVFVFDLNWKSLSDKASKAKINWDSLVRTNATEPGDDSSIAKVKREFENFIHSGIDTTSNVFFFVKSGGSIMSGQSTTGGVVAALKDPAAFEAYVKKHDNAPQIQKGSNFSYANLKDNLFVGWNDNVVILSGSQTQGFRSDSSNGMNNAPSGSSNSADQTLNTLFNQKEEESIASVPEFRDLTNEKADMLFWSNSGSMFSSVPMLGVTKFADLFKGSYVAGTINFEDGKAVANFKSYSGKELADLMKKYPGHEVDMSFVNKYPFPVSGFAAFSFNPQLLEEIIKYAGVESMVNQYLEKEGLTLNDVIKVFKGDFVIVFSDITTGGGNKPLAKLVFNATIGDKAAYDKIVSVLAKEGLMEMKDGQYVPAPMGDKFAWNMDGKNLTIATDNDLLQQYLSGKGNASVPSDVVSESKGKSAVVYVDINKILQTASTDPANESANAAKATFKNAIGTSEKFNGKYVESKFELNTVNQNENSLASLIKFFASVSGKIAEEGKKLKKGGMMNMDSTMMNMDSSMAPHDSQ